MEWNSLRFWAQHSSGSSWSHLICFFVSLPITNPPQKKLYEISKNLWNPSLPQHQHHLSPPYNIGFPPLKKKTKHQGSVRPSSSCRVRSILGCFNSNSQAPRSPLPAAKCKAVSPRSSRQLGSKLGEERSKDLNVAGFFGGEMVLRVAVGNGCFWLQMVFFLRGLFVLRVF